MVGKLNLNSGCRGKAGLDGRIQILFSRYEYSSPQGRLSYNNKPLISEENLYVMQINKVKSTWNKLEINRKFLGKKSEVVKSQDKDVSFNFY